MHADSSSPLPLIKFLFQQEEILDWSVIARKVNEEFRTNWTMEQCKQMYKQMSRYDRPKSWSQNEEKQLYTLHNELGNKWSIIASHFLGRSENCVKNHLYSKLRKTLRALNKIVRLCYKDQLKEISKFVLYKLTESSEEYPDISPEQVSQSRKCQIGGSQIQSHLDYSEEKELILQLLEFNKTYRKKTKKDKFESGLNSVNIRKALQKKRERLESLKKILVQEEQIVKQEENDLIE